MEIPKPCQQWIEAINDTLDGKVDENEYENPLIKQLFQVIATDQTTPEEYAQMKEEYNQKRIAEEKRIAAEEKLIAAEEKRIVAEEKRIVAEEKLFNTVRNLKELGKLTEIEIAQITNLTLEEVQAL